MLIAVASVAFIVTHFLAEWLQKRWGIVTGVEYIVLGAVLSPAFGRYYDLGIEVLTAETLTQVSPALVLGEGSLGLLAGVILNFRARDGVTARAFGAGLLVTLTTLGFVTLLPMAVATYFLGLDEAVRYLPHLLCFGAVASVASSAPLRSLIAFLDARGEGAQLVTRVARSSSSFAVIAFGVIFCLFKPASDLIEAVNYGPVVDVLFWLAVHVLFGVLLGLVFALFLLRYTDDEQILTIVIGMVIFTSGIGYFLKLSPIVVCFVLGVAFANTSPTQASHVQRMLLSIERPLYIVIFFFVGASMTLDVAWWAWFAAVPYLLLRAAGRNLGGVLIRAASPSLRPLPPVGPALLAPGPLSAAMLLNFQHVYSDQPLVAEVYAALLVAIVVSEPIAYRSSRRWLIDATDVSLSREGAGA